MKEIKKIKIKEISPSSHYIVFFFSPLPFFFDFDFFFFWVVSGNYCLDLFFFALIVFRHCFMVPLPLNLRFSFFLWLGYWVLICIWVLVCAFGFWFVPE